MLSAGSRCTGGPDVVKMPRTHYVPTTRASRKARAQTSALRPPPDTICLHKRSLIGAATPTHSHNPCSGFPAATQRRLQKTSDSATWPFTGKVGRAAEVDARRSIGWPWKQVLRHPAPRQSALYTQASPPCRALCSQDRPVLPGQVGAVSAGLPALQEHPCTCKAALRLPVSLP